MIQATIREIIKDQGELARQCDKCRIYKIRDKEDVLYVGRSGDVIGRINDHITKYVSSYIGDLINLNLPESLDWQVELLTIEECRSIIEELNPKRVKGKEINVETAEIAMIMHHRPCANTMNNVNPKPRPKHIKWLDKLEVGLTDNLY